MVKRGSAAAVGQENTRDAYIEKVKRQDVKLHCMYEVDFKFKCLFVLFLVLFLVCLLVGKM